MDCVSFLQAIWPDRGHYCIALKNPKGKGMLHHWFTAIPAAADAALALDAQGHTVYHACSTFRTPRDRKTPNAGWVKAFWLDLDVEPGNVLKFESKQEAARALRTFLEKTKLPNPMLVDSGAGLHVYWPFAQAMDALAARSMANLLKRLAAFHAFKIDPMRTADLSSVLRPPGTHNYKYTPAPEVKVLVGGDRFFDFFALSVLLEDAGRIFPNSAAPKRRQSDGVNAEFSVPVKYAPVSPDLVADKCHQMQVFRDTSGQVTEPVWYAGLQLLQHCVNGVEVAHEWSKGDARYSRENTDAKIAQVAAYGPPTCATFEARNPAGCAGCPFKGKISSPVQLGAQYVERPDTPHTTTVLVLGADELADPAVEQVPMPSGFKRTAQGIVFNDGGGVDTVAYENDLYVSEIAWDDAYGYEVCSVKHELPQEGVLEFAFRSAAVASPKDFEQAMRDNHVKPAHVGALRAYVTAYMMEVQRRRKMRKLYASMGWKDDTRFFVLGDRAYYSNGRIEIIGLSPSIKAVADGVKLRGELEPWVAATEVFNGKGMEAHALLFAVGAGAPLMKFTGFEGALFNAVGVSNAGKTSMARFFMSMYGDFDVMKLKQRDTDNAKIQRIGALSCLPAYVDEITNEDPMAVSDFVYEITQGRSKLRLRQDGTERPTQEWRTIVASSSNASLASKLGLAKANADAERMRFFEFRIDRQEAFTDAVAEHLYRVCAANYGHAGQAYIQYLVTHQEAVRAGLAAFITLLKQKCQARPEERMWMASLGCALYGLRLMAELKLIRFDYTRVVRWAVQQVMVQRAGVDDVRFSPFDTLGIYLNDNAGSRITVKDNGTNKYNGQPEFIPEKWNVNELHMRYELPSGKLWIDRGHFRNWVASRAEDYSRVVEYLEEQRVIVRHIRRTLGAGTGIATTAINCLEIDLTVPVLGNTPVREVVEEMQRITAFDQQQNLRYFQGKQQ